MDWNKLLSKQRLGREQSGPGDARSEYQRDYDRIVFSSAFRRLQDKTQVFPLAESDYVRTRLTHSIEASCVGRSLGTLVGEDVVKQGLVDTAITPQDLGNIVAAACLAHDIGNPPFGHSGEQAIGSWFKDRGKAFSEMLNPAEREELIKFEGNAQGFRILTRLQNHRSRGGLQLTCAMLGTFTKYPKASHTPGYEDSKKVSEKKFGFFLADKSNFSVVAEELGLRKKAENIWCRHPLAFLTEAADDICYRIVDFEDGYRRSRVSFSDAEELLKPIAFPSSRDLSESPYGALDDESTKIEYLRARAINTLVLAAADAFKANHDHILAGDFEQDLISQTPFKDTLSQIKDRSIKDVYAAPRVIEIEAAGFEVLGGLLDRLVPALTCPQDKLSAGDKKLRQLLPKQFQTATTLYEQLLNATDFVSGMTDSFAVTLYRRIRGIELPRG